MGRKPSRNLNLPSRMRARVRGETVYYYYDTGGKPRKEVALGADYVLAVQKWAGMHSAEPTEEITVGWAIGRYLASPQFDELGLGTQADYKFAIAQLMRKFSDAPMDQVRPSHVTLYIDKRSQESKHRALREKSVLSMIYSWSIARDYCKTNPAAEIRTKRLPGRKNIYITDDMLDAVYNRASPALKDAMDLAYFTGQRPVDVLRMSEANIRDGVLSIQQTKTTTPMRIAIRGELERLVERMAERKRHFAVRALALLVDESGKPMTKAKLRSRFEAARDAAGFDGAQFQFRDLRRKAAAELRDDHSLETAQDLLGHKDIRTTQHYASGKAKTLVTLPKKRAS